ncbi:hypothetical protein ABZ499_31900 [Streptomyces sp. NPDC019990]|uniref:hypothetical protein n=1 Tax=Streptomyces sp. NPDC019990 TaxID=3154693 RepID=UPI0033C96944
MTTTIMTRPASGFTAPDATDAHHQLGQLLTRIVREGDARVTPGQGARRTLQEMAPGYERQRVLTLHRPVMDNDACPLCGRWSCNGSDCPPGAALAPALVATGGPMNQCDRCGGWFGVTAARPAPATAWTCDACQALGR